MMNYLATLKSLAVFQNRLQGFIDDDYRIIVSYNSSTLLYRKLRNMKGNTIELKYYPHNGQIIQKSNHKVTYDSKMC